MDDVRAVMDTVASARALLLGISEGGPMSILFAATYPQRCTGLILYGSFPRWTWAPDYPWAMTVEEWANWMSSLDEWWGVPPTDVDPGLARQLAGLQRTGASPGAARALTRMNMDIDVRHVLATIRVPSLVLHKTGDWVPVEGARWMAGQIPGARFVELPGSDHIAFTEDVGLLLDGIESFAADVDAEGAWQDEPERVLATVLFTDIVGSTARAAELGDARWRELIQAHHGVIRRQLVRYRGTELDTAGDGFFASFDGPARAIRCACAISEGVRELGIEVRAGLHTGECERIDHKVGGIAVNIGARVAAEAGAGEVLVSSTVKDLVAGSGIQFRERGVAELKGVPGEWRLFAVEPAATSDSS